MATLGEIAAQTAPGKTNPQKCWEHITGVVQTFLNTEKKIIPVKNS
jgi:hypothetical protein